MKFYSPEELASLLKIENELILHWLETGNLTGFKIGEVWRVEASHFEEFLQKHCNKMDVQINVKSKVSKYSALTEYLSRINDEIITITFSGIEKVLDMELPKSARTYRAWWSNSTDTHVQASGWINAGRKVVRVDMEKHIVEFEYV